MSLRFYDLLLATSNDGASDLYLNAGAPPSIAVDGMLRPLSDDELSAEDTMDLLRQALSPAQIEEFHRRKDIDLALKTAENRYRVNAYYQRGTVAIVARLIRTDMKSFDELGLPPQLGDLAMRQRGIIFVTGSTGSGKSTTLASMIDYRNVHSSGHIVTIEDPIEFTHEHKGCLISQREVGLDTADFASAIRSALRQAPDVILIGEVRDRDTAQFTLHASDTGHLVLTTLHTNNANQTIERLLNLFPPEHERAMLQQLSLNLAAVVSQRLVPRIRGGRIAAIELLINTARIGELIQNKRIEDMKDSMARGGQEGMQTFDLALYRLVQAGHISEQTAIDFSDSPNDLKLRLRGVGGSGMIAAR